MSTTKNLRRSIRIKVQLSTNFAVTQQQKQTEQLSRPKRQILQWSDCDIHLIGSGRVGVELAQVLMQREVRTLTVYDPAKVTSCHLGSHHFHKHDLGQPKAVALIKRLKKTATHPVELRGYPWRIEEILALNIEWPCTIAICTADDDLTCRYCAAYFSTRAISCAFIKLSTETKKCSLFLQDSRGQQCWWCAHCQFVNSTQPCQDDNRSSKDRQQEIALVSEAIHQWTMEYKLQWRYTTLCIDSGAHTATQQLIANATCHVCGKSIPAENID